MDLASNSKSTEITNRIPSNSFTLSLCHLSDVFSCFSGRIEEVEDDLVAARENLEGVGQTKTVTELTGWNKADVAVYGIFLAIGSLRSPPPNQLRLLLLLLHFSDVFSNFGKKEKLKRRKMTILPPRNHISWLISPPSG